MRNPVTLIVACAANRVIGRAGKLPFSIPEDKAWFHRQTAGKTVVMGRICFQAWPQATADGRRAIVITRDARLDAGGGRVVSDVPAALALAQTCPGEIMICGGQRVFEETLPLADRLLLTLVHADVSGDRWFPDWRQLHWREAARRDSQDANHRYTFLELERQA